MKKNIFVFLILAICFLNNYGAAIQATPTINLSANAQWINDLSQLSTNADAFKKCFSPKSKLSRELIARQQGKCPFECARYLINQYCKPDGIFNYNCVVKLADIYDAMQQYKIITPEQNISHALLGNILMPRCSSQR